MLRLLVLIVGLALVPFTPIPRPVIPAISAPLAIEAVPAPESEVAAVQITAVPERRLVFDCQPAAPNQQGVIADCTSRWVEAD